MKNSFRFLIACLGFSLFSFGCSQPTADKESASVAMVTETKPDMAAIKAEIQAIEKAWSAADNAKDSNSLGAFLANDAVSMSANSPMAVGKAAIIKEMEAGFASRPAGQTVSYEVLDVFGDDKLVTEVGKSTRMDASGKVISTGNYMAIWEKRDGKWLCIRDIGYSNTKEN